ncbi:MAG TPA: succinate dehydrogenase, cytochrome b556 subunit [Burkholderiales bacterium]|nr:succinate dehydrogenase, cytochrome b556 subunit [Burkholderiales bacterium]
MIASRRPKFLDLSKIRLPVPGLVSILHRISGAALFLFAGVLLYLFQESLATPDSYVRFRDLADHWLAKLFLIGMLWAFLHHFFAGLRYLLLDVDIGTELRTTRAMSRGVLGVSLVLTIVLGICLW